MGSHALTRRRLAPPCPAPPRLARNGRPQVKGLANVFALGDAAATNNAKTGWATKAQADIVVKNIAALVHKRELKRGPLTPEQLAIFIVPIGPSHGFAQVPGIFRPNFITL